MLEANMKKRIAAPHRAATIKAWRSALALLVFCGVVRVSFAHSDPRGDVYPNVKVEGGNFVIDFHNNDSGNEGDDIEANSDDRPRLRMIYSAEGELLAPRHLHGGKRTHADTIDDSAKERAQVGDETIIVARGLSVQPLYTSKRNGRTEVHRLPWPDDFSPGFEALCAGTDFIGIAAIKNNQNLVLAHFDRHHFALPQMMQLSKGDELSFIWHFPVVSNLVRVGNRYCIAWPRYNKAAQTVDCVISTWKPGEDEPKDIVLKEPGALNTHLSLAAIGSRLCLVYHGFNEDSSRPLSTIIVVFRTIED